MHLPSVIVFYLLGSTAAHLSFYLNETETKRLLGMTSFFIKLIKLTVFSYVSVIMLFGFFAGKTAMLYFVLNYRLLAKVVILRWLSKVK